MKRIFTILFAVMAVGQVWAATTFTVGNLKYTVTDEENHCVSVEKGSSAPTGELKIPSQVKHKATTYTVTSIGDYAFYNCSGLTSVIIPKSVTSIGDGAFSSCSGLQYNEYDNALYLGNENNQYLCLVKAKSNNIASCEINNKCKFICSSAFNNCSSLSSVTIPNSITSIGSDAFNNCDGLQYNEYDNAVYLGNENNPYLCLVKAKSINITSCEINNQCKIIYSSAFDECPSLASITIPNSITSIGNRAFDGCSGLTELNVESDNTSYISEDGVLFNKEKTILIRYPRGKQDLLYTIPDDVKLIGETAFRGCDSLAYIIIPNSVTDIDNAAFAHCNGLKYIAIGNGLVRIGRAGFQHCRNLMGIYSGSRSPDLGDQWVFESVDYTIPICVPEDYPASSWCGFSNIHKGHNIVAVSASTATCTEYGLSEGTFCSLCGKLFTAQVVPALGHAYDTVTFAPTCTNVGYKELTCTRCNDVIYIDTVAANGHSYSYTVTTPTCTNVGYTTHTCSVCEYTYNSDTVSANGHTPDSIVFENIIAATCTAAGSYDSVVYCSVCQTEQFREGKEVASNGHSYITSITDPTCTEVGYTTHVCSVCNHTYNSDTVAANGHTEVVGAAVAATCTTTGKTEGKHCSVCNEVIVAQTEVAALGHNYGDYVYNNDATTDADGTETATCSRCGEKDTRPAAGTKLPETEKGTAVSESAASAINIYAHHNIIVIENATDEIRVFDAMGKMVACGGRDDVHIVSTGTTAITIKTPGVYIVKTGETVKRVIVN